MTDFHAVLVFKETKTSLFSLCPLILRVRSVSNSIDREVSGSSVVPDRSHMSSRVANSLKNKISSPY